MTEEKLKEELFSRYGAVTRARGCFLYTKKGVRLTDLYQADGRAILGWGGGDAFTKLKNVLNRGITGNFVTEYSSQIDKAVSELLQSERKVVFSYTSPETGVNWEPWDESWKESLKEHFTENNNQVITVKPPLPWSENLYMVCVTSDFDDSQIENKVKLPAPLVAAVTRSVYDLIAAIKVREEKDWFIYDQILSKYFERKGPYLYSKLSEEEYDDFVLFCLDKGIVINPKYNVHSIVPYGADKGVFTKLK